MPIMVIVVNRIDSQTLWHTTLVDWSFIVWALHKGMDWKVNVATKVSYLCTLTVNQAMYAICANIVISRNNTDSLPWVTVMYVTSVK